MSGERSLHAFHPNALLYPLHLSLAGIFAFVLPFICWGALATPGHPHGLPHFVFSAPQTRDSEKSASHVTHDGHAEDDMHAAAKPVAQSVSPILAVALLAPILLLIASLPVLVLCSLARREGEAVYTSYALPPLLRPPRQSTDAS